MIFVASLGKPPMPRHIESADLPEDIARIAEAQVAAGRFASVEDVVRAGVEAVARIEQKRAAVRAALEEGEQSGIVEGDAFASVRAELGLPPR
jgi:antitoxin ParD1/3/4